MALKRIVSNCRPVSLIKSVVCKIAESLIRYHIMIHFIRYCRLISKFRSYGVNDQLILWIKDFLMHMSQRMKINNESVCGIPQCPRNCYAAPS